MLDFLCVKCYISLCIFIIVNNETLLLNGSVSETLSHTVQSNSLKQNYLLKNTSKYPVVHISYNEVPGYCAMVAKALDDDEGRNAQLRYGISRKYLHKTQRGRGEKEDKTANILDAFTMDPPSGRVMLTRNLNVNELGLYELVLTTIQLLVEDTPPRGNWLFPEIEQSHDLSSLFSTKYAITETHTILVVIILSGISAFLASVLISAILCMIKPCKKSNSVNRLNKNSCTKKCIINSNENNGIISFNKDYNASMCGDYDLNKMPMDQSNMLSYDDYNLNLLSHHHHHHQHHHDQQFQSSSFTTENDGTLLDPTFSPFHQYHHHHHPDSIVISGDSTTLSGIDNYYLPPYKLPGIDNYIGNSTNTSNNVTTTTTTPTATAANIPTACINRMDGGKQEEEEEEKLHLMKRTTSPCVQRTSPPTQQPKWSYLQFQFPYNDRQQIMPNISCNMSPRCSTYSPQHINTYNPVSQTSRQSVISPSLKKTNSVSPNHHLSNVSTVYDLGLNSPIHSNLMQHNNNPISIDCTVKDSPHSVQIIGEEQRSDSGRGASDEENSNQVQMNNNTTVSPVNSSSSTAASDMFQGNGLKASVVNQKASSNQKFRSNTLKCYTDNSSNITTGLIYPSLPRVNMYGA
ncbi:unnamed protein product [Trichobilharzia regenti]|nr:unnamed protein product [Trichobilharzia regenti]